MSPGTGSESHSHVPQIVSSRLKLPFHRKKLWECRKFIGSANATYFGEYRLIRCVSFCHKDSGRICADMMTTIILIETFRTGDKTLSERKTRGTGKR